MNDTTNSIDNPNDKPSGKPQPPGMVEVPVLQEQKTSQPRVSRISTDKLFNGVRELIIEHTGEEYRLRITSKGKLILTK